MASAVCAVCLRVISTTTTGLLRTHVPLAARHLGSGKPLRLLAGTSSPLTSSRQQGPSSSPCGPSLSSTLAVAPVQNVRVLRRIPKSARRMCSSKLTTLLEDVVRSNSVEAWNKLFLFTPTCLRPPRRSKRTESLSSWCSHSAPISCPAVGLSPRLQCMHFSCFDGQGGGFETFGRPVDIPVCT